MLLKALLQTLDDSLRSAAGRDFSLSRLRVYYLAFFPCYFSVVAFLIEDDTLTRFPTSPATIPNLLMLYGVMNLGLSLTLAREWLRWLVASSTVLSYAAMVTLYYSPLPHSWRVIGTINLLYALTIGYLLLVHLVSSKFRAFFLTHLSCTLLAVQLPLLVLVQAPAHAVASEPLQTVLLGFAGSPVLVLLASLGWTAGATTIVLGGLIVLSVVFFGYSFLLAGRALSIRYLSAVGVGMELILVPVVIYLLVCSRRRGRVPPNMNSEQSKTP
jgi:hypothetical protein